MRAEGAPSGAPSAADPAADPAASGPSAWTAFRREEKRYQRHQARTFRTRKGRRVSGPLATRPTDVSALLDARDLPALAERAAAATAAGAHRRPGTASTAAGVRRVAPSPDSGAAAFELVDHPGCRFLPGALDAEAQRRWLAAAFRDLCEPPARTNHHAAHGDVAGLWRRATDRGAVWRLLGPEEREEEEEEEETNAEDDEERAAARAEKTAWKAAREDGDDDVEAEAEAEAEAARAAASTSAEAETEAEAARAASRWALHPGPAIPRGDPRSSRTARVLLDKLRWATIGPRYDWTARAYEPPPDRSPDDEATERLVEPSPRPTPVSPMSPPRTKTVPSDLRALCRDLARRAGFGDDFRAEAGLVNYYLPGDALAGHVDDAEPDDARPIVSVSLGAPCVFLIGGATREVRPAAVCLRSGDAVVIGGDARRWFHGVPRVFAPDDPIVVSRRSKGVFEEGRHEEGFTQEGFTQEGRFEEGFSVRAPREVGDPDAWPEERDVAERVAQGARVNLSLREGIYESRRDAYSTSSR